MHNSYFIFINEPPVNITKILFECILFVDYKGGVEYTVKSVLPEIKYRNFTLYRTIIILKNIFSIYKKKFTY